MAIIGSTAIKHWFPEFPREPHDLDVLAKPAGYQGNKVEFHDIPLLNPFSKVEYLPPNALYTLKISHIFWPIKWQKHIFDIWWLTGKGCQLDRALFDNLYLHWCARHGTPTRANLATAYSDFFNNALDNQDKHDELHKLLKNPPTYTRILVGEILTSDELFSQLSVEDRLSLIHEETCVMAYERLAGRDYRTAYMAQLKEMILHHLPFEQALFTVLSFDKLKLPWFNYVEALNGFPGTS